MGKLFKMSSETGGRPFRLLLTGERGAGKTALCFKVLRQLGDMGKRCGGVLCPKLLGPEQEVVGIQVIDLLSVPSVPRTLARKDRPLEGPSFGAFFFSEEALQFGREALEKGAGQGDVLFADELGPLEMQGHGFFNLFDLIRNPRTPPMVISVRPALVPEVCHMMKSIRFSILEISPSNRDQAVPRLVSMIQGALSSGRDTTG